MTDRVGQQLGNYHLIRLLGRGGFAEVYLGEHLRLKTQAAIKVLHTSLEGDDRDSFLREAQTVVRLKHPHIVRVFDFDVEEHLPFLVMDYLPNGNVRQRHPKGTSLPLITIASYVTQVASALQYAHDEKLIHRDIKPENMLLDQRNTIVLSDFGIALMAQSSRYQNTQEVAGTAAYMAPEQFQGKPRRASDQYALGVVVYEWLSGNRPFHGSFTEIASQHLFVPPPSLQKKMPTISPEIEQVVFRALAKDPFQRFPSIQVFAHTLEQACKSKSSLHSTSSGIPSSVKPPVSRTQGPPKFITKADGGTKIQASHEKDFAQFKPAQVAYSKVSDTPKSDQASGVKANILTEGSSQNSSGSFKMRYLLGIVIYLLSANFIGVIVTSFFQSNHLDSVLTTFNLFGGLVVVRTSTLVYLLALFILLVVLALLQLLPYLSRLMNMIKAKPTMPHSKISLGRGITYFLITVAIYIILIIVIDLIPKFL